MPEERNEDRCFLPRADDAPTATEDTDQLTKLAQAILTDNRNLLA